MEQRRKKIGLLTLGVTLIFIGTAILMNRYTDYQFTKDLGLMWPAFLILLGIEFIATKVYYDSKKQDIHLSPSILSIVLVIAILFSTVMWHNLSLGLNNFNFNFLNNWGAVQYQYQLRESLEPELISVDGVDKVEIRNHRGSVDVQPWDQSSIKISAEIVIDTNDKENAIINIDNIINVSNGKTTTIYGRNIFTNNDNHQINAINLSIWIPRDMELNVESRFGNILIVDLENNATAKQEHGSVEFSNITGNAVISSRHTRIRIKGIDGNVQVINSHGETSIDEVTGYVDVENSYNSTNVKNIGLNVIIKSRHGMVNSDNIQGNVRIDNEYNTTYASNILGDLTIKSKHGAVNLKSISGDINAENSYKQIKLINVNYENAAITASTTYNKIYAQKHIGLDIEIETNAQNGSITNGNGDQTIRLQNRHGEIRIETE